MQKLIDFRAPSPTSPSGRAIFPYGAHVYREPSLPLEQLRHDLPILKRLGFNMVKLQEVWAHDEKREGEIDLSKVSQLVSEAGRHGLRVYFGVTMESAPAWLWKKYPDASLVYETGEAHNDPTQYILPSDGKPGPCWHHHGARAAAIRFIETVGREIGKYENIHIWNIWQEIGFWPMRPGHRAFCYCRHTLPAFHKWLRGRYETLRELNETWKTAYGDWEEVQPPRFHPQVPQNIDWRYFMDNIYLSEVLRWKAEAFRRSDPYRRPVMAHVGAPQIGTTRGRRYAEAVDIYGSSSYPSWGAFSRWDYDAPLPGQPISKGPGLRHELWESIMMRFDFLRCESRNGEFWVAELQGGPIVRGLNRGRVPEAADVRRWVLGSLAGGARGLCFWNHRPEILWEEGYGFSLLDWSDELTPRAKEAGRLAQALDAYSDLFSGGKHPQSAVALVMNESLFHFAEASKSNVLEHYLHTIRGIYRALWEAGIPVDFVDAEQLPSGPKQYKALILPFPVALDESVIQGLRTYVRSGGVLVSEACPGRFSKYGLGFKGEMAVGVEELFGASHKQVRVVREPGNGAKWTRSEVAYGDSVEYRDLSGAGEFSSFSVFPAYYLQTLWSQSSKPILMFRDDVAGCAHNFGQGTAYLVGTLLGHAILSYNDSRNGQFLTAILARAGVVPDRVGNLTRRQRIRGNQVAWFFFNTTDQVVEEIVPIIGFKTARDLFGDTIHSEERGIRIRVASLDVRCVILEK